MTFRAVPLLRMLLIAALIGPAAAFAFLAALSHETAFERAEQTLARRTNLLVEHSLRVFDAHRLVAERVTDLLQEAGQQNRDERFVHERMSRYIANLPQIYSIWVTNADGRLAASTAVYPAPRDIDFTDRDYFHLLRDNPDNGLVASEVARGKVDGKLFFAIGFPRRDAQGRFAGVIAISAIPEYFSEVYGRMLGGVADVASLVREDGAFLARFPGVAGKADIPYRRLGPDSGLMRAIARDGPVGTFRSIAVTDGVERLYAYQKVPGLPAYLSVGRNVERVEAEWWKEISRFLPLVLTVTALLGGISWVALRRARAEELALIRLKDALDQREVAAAALRRAQRLEAMGQLTGGVAHDFNNLLQVMNGGLNLLGKPQPDDRRAMILDSLQRAVGRGQALTRQLLSFARRQPLAPAPLRLDAAFDRLGLLLRQLLRTDIDLVVDIGPVWPVLVDAAELELAVLNLGVNARDAMPNGGSLIITARQVPRNSPDAPVRGPEREPESYGEVVEPPEGHAPGPLSGDFVALTIADTGVGIPADVLDKVYEPFFTTKEAGKGTGLGLSQVYGFARQSGGTVTIDSQIGRGTAVTLFLPRAVEEGVGMPDADPETASSPSSTALPCLRILLVEDNPEIRETTKEVLSGAGHQVMVAGTGEEALGMLEAEPDLVISDIMLGAGMDGLDLARTARRTRPDLPIVLVTGYSRSAKIAAADGFPVLRKPYDFNELQTLAAGLVAKRRAGGTGKAEYPPPGAGLAQITRIT